MTGLPLIQHAARRIIGWQECSEIVLMGVLVWLLIWHVNRHRAAQARLAELRDTERVRAHNREVAARFGSHEVRTRLTIARGFAELIHDAATGEPMRSDASVVLTEFDKASALTTKLLDLVRFETPAATQPLDIDELIDTIVMRWSATADRVWSAAAAVGTLPGDAERLEAALDCLIENAVKFTAPGDSIAVEARHRDGQVLISVRDTGAGIPAGDLERIAEIFQTGSSAGARAGSGLGLAIVRSIAEARGGGLDITSTEGAGTCMTIRLAADGLPTAIAPVLLPDAIATHLHTDALRVG